jgi:hypothetical protein
LRLAQEDRMLTMASLLAAALTAGAPAALAQAPLATDLPSLLEGKWIYVAPNGRRSEGRAVLKVDARTGGDGDAGGGRLTWDGNNCKGVDLPATVRYDGRQLVVTAKFDDGEVCGTQTLRLERTDRSGFKSLFEGTVAGTGQRVAGVTAQVILDPK